LAATPDSVTVETGHGPRELAWAEIEAATVQVEFRRGAAAGVADAPVDGTDEADEADDEQEG
jgi:hypothetical protein